MIIAQILAFFFGMFFKVFLEWPLVLLRKTRDKTTELAEKFFIWFIVYPLILFYLFAIDYWNYLFNNPKNKTLDDVKRENEVLY